MAFILLLILSGIELSLNLESIADTTAIYSFYFLVAGLALQIASFLKYKET
jgi:hypothetical protein